MVIGDCRRKQRKIMERKQNTFVSLEILELATSLFLHFLLHVVF